MIPKPEKIAVTKAKKRADKQRCLWKVRQEVDERDGSVCRICKSFAHQPHHHHIVYRSHGGLDTLENIILVCARCHDQLHSSGKLRLSGDADSLMIERFNVGRWVNESDDNK